MGEQQETQHRREFVALRNILADCDVFFSRSWWRVLLRLWAVLGHNILHIVVGFIWLPFVSSGPPVPQLAGMAKRTGDGKARNGHWLAARGISSFLDAEESPWSTWEASRSKGHTAAHPPDESREPALGRAKDTRQVAQTGYRHQRIHRKQIFGPIWRLAFAELENFLGKYK